MFSTHPHFCLQKPSPNFSLYETSPEKGDPGIPGEVLRSMAASPAVVDSDGPGLNVVDRYIYIHIYYIDTIYTYIHIYI